MRARLSSHLHGFPQKEPVERRSSESGEFVAVHTTTIGTPKKSTRPEGGALLAAALAATIDLLGARDVDVAYWCDIDRKTLYRWLNRETTVAVERIVMSPRLWPTFDRELNRLREESGLVRRFGT